MAWGFFKSSDNLVSSSHNMYVYSVCFYLKQPNCCGLEAVICSGRLLCTGTHGWEGCTVGKWCSLLDCGAAFRSTRVLKENSFISLQFWMYEVPASAVPETTWLTLAVHIGWGQDAVTALLHCMHRYVLRWDIPGIKELHSTVAEMSFVLWLQQKA